MSECIDSHMIDAAERGGACDEAIAWLRRESRTIQELADLHPYWLLWAAGNAVTAQWISDDRIAAVLGEWPGVALAWASHRLSDAQFAAAIVQEPSEALAGALVRLTDARFEAAIKASPRGALAYATSRMTPEQHAAVVDAMRAEARALHGG